MIKIVGIRFKSVGKIYYFDPNGLKINKNDYICSFCQQSHGYSTKNHTYQGKQTQISFSFEFDFIVFPLFL